MTEEKELPEVEVTDAAYFSRHFDELRTRLDASGDGIIRPPGGPSATAVTLGVRDPVAWLSDAAALREALSLAAREDPGIRYRAVEIPLEDRLTLTVEEAGTLLGISRAFAYEAVRRGEIPSIRIGRRVLVPKVALQRMLGPDESGNQPSTTPPDAV